ncbi:MAG: AMP-binding protein [Pseudomonadota bacterium]
MNALIRILIRFLISLRYRVKVTGLSEVEAKGRRGILFLSSHPALVDPVIIMTLLHRDFAPRAIGDELRINRPFIGRFSRRFGVRVIPDISREGAAGVARTRQVISETIEGLRKGENLLLYPAGRMKRAHIEEVGATSAVETILESVPDVRVVLIRQNGLWGSSFSWASGKSPDVVEVLKKNLKYILMNGIFFMPRRPVEIEFVEPGDFPRGKDRATINRFIEDFYNAGAWANTFVPHKFWEKGGIRVIPEPEPLRMEGDVKSVPETTRRLVREYLKDLTGRERIREEDSLTYDLGLDSLAMTEIILWVEKEFGFSGVNTESLRTVGDVLLAATGRGIATGPPRVKPPSARWFRYEDGEKPLFVPEGRTIADVFLRQAGSGPDRIIVADQISGEKRYRDLIAGILALRPQIEKMPGKYLGIMLPASVAAVVSYLAVLFSGKIPVMINWTTGPRNILRPLDLVGVRHILTSRVLISRIEGQGVELSELTDRFVFLEEIRGRISFWDKLRAFAGSRTRWGALKRAQVSETAVTLFTSGSESLPKVVPLSHTNILTNIRDVSSMFTLRQSDIMIGILPPFHSFGITATIILPLLMGLRTVYYPNPTEAPTLARIIDLYKATLLVGTPTFLNGIVRASVSDQLKPLRLAISGAEKCPDHVYKALQDRCPAMKVLEGYGVTECSPIISVNSEANPRPYKIGTVLASLEYRLVDVDTGLPAENDKPGMLLVRGPSVFGGYLHHTGKSPFVEYEGEEWYSTGDLISRDKEGVLTFRGRLKRFVKLGGEMISLPAIEEALAPLLSLESDERPAFAVESTPDEETPELVLFTTRATDRETVNNQIRNAGLSPLHNIRKIVRVEEIPVLGTGKSDYRRLKESLK